MRRRTFIRLLGGIASWPLLAHAQKAPVKIGLLVSGVAGSIYSTRLIEALNEGLLNVGMTAGRDYLIETQYAAGHYERFPELAAALAKSGVRLILAHTIASVRAAQGLTPSIPVVMISINDPVGAKLVASLANSGNQTTGLANLTEDVTIKLMEFQREVVPNATTIAVLYNRSNPTNPKFLEKIKAFAAGLNLRVLPAEYEPDELNSVFAKLAAQRPDALHVLSDSGLFDVSDTIATLCLEHRIPSFATYPDFAALGGLLAYGASRRKLFIRSGYYAKKIIDGTPPAELPIEQPTRVELAINLKTARALNLDMPNTLLATADQVIE